MAARVPGASPAVMLPEAPLRVGGPPGIESSVGAFEDVAKESHIIHHQQLKYHQNLPASFKIIRQPEGS